MLGTTEALARVVRSETATTALPWTMLGVRVVLVPRLAVSRRHRLPLRVSVLLDTTATLGTGLLRALSAGTIVPRRVVTPTPD